MQTQSDSGIVSRLGARSVDETVTKLQTLLEQRKISSSRGRSQR